MGNGRRDFPEDFPVGWRLKMLSLAFTQTTCVGKICVGGDQESMGQFTGPCYRFVHFFVTSEHPQIHLCLLVPMVGASAGKLGFDAGTGLSPHGWVFPVKRWGRVDLFMVQVTFAYVLISKFCSREEPWNVLAGGGVSGGSFIFLFHSAVNGLLTYRTKQNQTFQNWR